MLRQSEAPRFVSSGDVSSRGRINSDFLGQTHAISDDGTRTKHILMTCHSAPTLAAKVASNIRMLEFNGEKTEAIGRDKGELIRSLSAGLITFTENEVQLSITHVLKNTAGPVLFTEGVTDEIILETAWTKFYPDAPRPFDIQGTFGCGSRGCCCESAPSTQIIQVDPFRAI
ncbi:hypothetical protein AS026_20235 [Rhizobium altiplani]|uniref:Uncharacterized protein n=1 Tax=Rhizobium altiplani TaxID=1864509 RepID=A0A120FFJ5_9HYPH|nr:hypothetical protein AS026_20235 [Rhizobium altiplani]